MEISHAIPFFSSLPSSGIHQYEGCGGWLAWFADSRLKKRFIEIGDVTLASNIFLPHPQCAIVSSGVVVGSNAHSGQYVTIGGNFKRSKAGGDGVVQRLSIIDDRLMIHPEAVIGGPVTISDDGIIVANSVVTRDVTRDAPSTSVIFGQNELAAVRIVVLPEGGEYEVIEEIN